MLLSDELMNKIAKMQKKNIAVEILNQALKDYVEKVGIQNIVMQEKFSTKFQKIATAYNERTSVVEEKDGAGLIPNISYKIYF